MTDGEFGGVLGRPHASLAEVPSWETRETGAETSEETFAATPKGDEALS